MLAQIAAMPADLRDLPFATAVITQLQRSAATKRWAPTTLLKYMAASQGALATLPLYSNYTTAIALGRGSPEWRLAMRRAQIDAKEFVAHVPMALTEADFYQTFRASAGDPELQAYLAVIWLTCARPGCVRQLKAEDLSMTFLPGGAADVAVTFRRGKGVIFRGPYTVHTTLFPEAARLISGRLANIGRTDFIWDPAGRPHPSDIQQRLLAALRATNAAYEQRSLRRGSLQTLSAQGVPEATLMEFSGHTNVRTLRRYLNYGAKSGDMRARTTAAAQHLQPRPPAPAPHA
jgi:integrase